MEALTDIIRRRFEYRTDPVPGLYNRDYPNRHYRTRPGERAGSPGKGDRVIVLHRTRYPESHCVWIWHNGPVPEVMRVIPKDGNCRNVAIENLHLVPQGTKGFANFRYPLTSRNRTGRVGVCYSKDRGYIATIGCRYLGAFPTFDQALRVRREAERSEFPYFTQEP